MTVCVLLTKYTNIKQTIIGIPLPAYTCYITQVNYTKSLQVQVERRDWNRDEMKTIQVITNSGLLEKYIPFNYMFK